MRQPPTLFLCLFLCLSAVLLLSAPASAASSSLEGVARDLLGTDSGKEEKKGKDKDARDGKEARDGKASKGGKAQRGAGLGADRLSAGLREALRSGTAKTVKRLGRTDGYLKDRAVHIPLPESLQQARSALALAGLSGSLDDLEVRMNRAAEAAAPKAGAIFGDAIAAMGIDDARAILDGPDDAATRYFQRTTTKPLTRAFRPIVEQELSQAGAYQAYQAVAGRAGPLLGDFNLTDYVVGKGLDGLFHYVALEEAAIRANPADRTSDLLRSVFSY